MDIKASSRIKALRTQAVLDATFEIVSEQRDEIVRRARAKLIAQGIQFSDEDIEEASPLKPLEAEG